MNDEVLCSNCYVSNVYALALCYDQYNVDYTADFEQHYTHVVLLYFEDYAMLCVL